MKPALRTLFIWGACAWTGYGTSTWATDDRALLEGTTITGNRELPKVLYIVPWKAPPGVSSEMTGADGILGEPLAPLDRDIFARALRYGLASPGPSPAKP